MMSAAAGSVHPRFKIEDGYLQRGRPLEYRCLGRKKKQLNSISNLFGTWNDKMLSLNLTDFSFGYADPNPKKLDKITKIYLAVAPVISRRNVKRS